MFATRQIACVVKVGGAAITDKGQLETLDAAVLDATAAQLAQAVSECPVIVVHGAGSFGHHQASQAGVHLGGIDKPSVKLGFAETRASVTKLNGLVVQALLREGIPAVGLSPCGTWTTANREVVADGCSAVNAALEAGLVPVVHGDAVFDTVLGCTILGGDPLVARLCREFRPQCAVFLTNVPGVFSRPPGDPGAELLSRIEVLPDGSWTATCAGSGTVLTAADVQVSTSQHDTTGGIQQKVAEAASIALGVGVEVRVAQAGTPAALQACLPGPLPQDWVGTVIVSVGR